MKTYNEYQYHRESDKTPYYIGKGCGDRLYTGLHTVNIPPNLENIQIIKDNLTDQEARELEISLIKQYGRKNNNTGILRNLTDGGEGRPGKNSTVGRTTREERAHKRKLRLQQKADRIKMAADKKAEREIRRARKLAELEQLKLSKIASKQRRKILKDEEVAKQKLQYNHKKGLPLTNLPTLCPCCKIHPVAINYQKNGKTYYRKKCNRCYRSHKKPMPAGWVRSGYKKKDSCFRCRRKLNYPESSIVWHIDGNADNCDWLNLRTVCLVCAIDLQHGAKLPNTTISADF